MPNRILRDWTDSFTIHDIGFKAEVFFVRLIMKVDDYGRFYADERLLKANLFPLATDIRETDISRWLAACEKAGLIALYNVAGKRYLEINSFNQRLRQKKERFPSPQKNNDGHSSDISQSMDGVKRNEVETESEEEGELAQKKFLIPEMLEMWKTAQPKYPVVQEKDFVALGEISKFILAQEKIPLGLSTEPESIEKVKNAFSVLIKHITSHHFFVKYSLSQIATHIQAIIQDFNNGQTNNPKNGQPKVDLRSAFQKLSQMSD